MPVTTEKIRCPHCGAIENLKIGAQAFSECENCGCAFVVNIAREFYKVEVDRAKDIANLRRLLCNAVKGNYIDDIKDIAGKIKEIIPGDYSAGYYSAYAAAKRNSVLYMDEFYQAEVVNATDAEKAEILRHMMKNCELRDYDRVKDYIGRTGGGKFVQEFNVEFGRREVEAENHRIVPRDVFVCHRSTEKNIAYEAVKHIENDGYECWISYRNLCPNDAENYWQNIEKSIEKCDIFLVISSRNAMLSKDVQREIETADNLNKPRIEYKIDAQPHTNHFKAFFNGVKWIDASDDPYAHFNSLCQRVFEEQKKLKKQPPVEKAPQERKPDNNGLKGEIDRQLNKQNLLKYTPASETRKAESEIDRQIREARGELEREKAEAERKKAAAEQARKQAEAERQMQAADAEERRIKEAQLAELNAERERLKKEEEKDFYIVNGELFRYLGKEGDVVIPDSVTYIGRGSDTFYNRADLTSVTIPKSVTRIESTSFIFCTGLTSIVVSKENPVYKSEGNCIVRISDNALIAGCKTSVIPDYVTSIGMAFSGCMELTNIMIPASVARIDGVAFRGCTGLTSIIVSKENPVYKSDGNCIVRISDNALIAGCKASVIPDYVTSIGDYAFHSCPGLTNITIPDGVKRIGDYAFDYCSGLTSITIPDGVTSVGHGAFMLWRRNQTIYINKRRSRKWGRGWKKYCRAKIIYRR